MRNNAAALIATTAVLAAAAAGARYTPANVRDGVWYAALEKPRYRPPGPAIGVAWTVLDVLLAYAGTRLLKAPATAPRQAALAGWAISVGGLVAYPWLMFGRHRLGAALASVGVMLAGTLTAVGAGATADRRAAGALLPLVGWLAFAGLLQEEIWRKNR